MEGALYATCGVGGALDDDQLGEEKEDELDVKRCHPQGAGAMAAARKRPHQTVQKQLRNPTAHRVWEPCVPKHLVGK